MVVHSRSYGDEFLYFVGESQVWWLLGMVAPLDRRKTHLSPLQVGLRAVSLEIHRTGSFWWLGTQFLFIHKSTQDDNKENWGQKADVYLFTKWKFLYCNVFLITKLTQLILVELGKLKIYVGLLILYCWHKSLWEHKQLINMFLYALLYTVYSQQCILNHCILYCCNFTRVHSRGKMLLRKS